MTKAKKMFNLYDVSAARNVLFGIATLWIGLFHSHSLDLANYTSNRFLSEAFRLFRTCGNVGVDIFLLLSGIGLYFSFTKDSRVLSFWKKRFMRVLPTAFLIGTIFFSLRYVHGRYKDGLLHYISRETFTYFFFKGERVFWFISLILLLYLLFPLFYKVIDRFRLFGMLGLVAVTVGFIFLLRAVAPTVYGNTEIALCRIPVFIVGIWAGRFVMEKREISRLWLWLCLAVVIVTLMIMYRYDAVMGILVPGYNKDMKVDYNWVYRFNETFMGIALTMLFSFVVMSIRRRGWCNILRNFLEFVGMYSMEYYLIYLNINAYMAKLYKISARQYVMLYFGSFIASLVLCVLSRKVCDYFMDYMQRKPKNWEELKAARKAKKLNK